VDGRLSFEDQPRNRWTCYGTRTNADWLAIDLGAPREVGQAILWLYDDQIGVRAPASVKVQYWQESGWTDCPNSKATPAVPHGGITNVVTFPKVVSRKFRAVFTHQKGSSSGVTEFGLYPPAPQNPAKTP
jgi:hypothetical protein